jgi:hypothetical protein
MPNLILMMLSSLLAALRTQAAIQAEILALRHQLIVLQRTQRRSVSFSAQPIDGYGFGSRDYGPAGVLL